MKIKLLKIDSMVNNGENILKNLQNSVIDDLDLLVRESIQNSLDAGIENKDVQVSFKIGNFRKTLLKNKLEQSDSFDRLFNEEYQDYISIKDLNTVGLTGPLSYKGISDLKIQGNLLRLAFSMGNAQTQSGAGGSWGLGKTLYYRIGVGLVIYYSRIKLSNNEYEERLVGVLVENQNNKNTIIDHKKNKSTGIAWWGEYNDENDLIPIRGSNEIKEILDIFGIKQFVGNETGTNIIIPFINKKRLYDNAVINNEKAENYYMGEIEEYLKYSIQRWYFPRLNNPKYKLGKKNNLTVYINDEKITNNDENKLFKILRGMYNYAVTNNDSELKSLLNNDSITKEDISVQKISNMNGNLVGRLVFGKFNYKELDMVTAFDNSNPIFLSNTNKEYDNKDNVNPPMILYTRMPGMIVNYDSNGKWVSGLENTPIEDYIIGIFVLNSDEDIYFNVYNNNGGILTLEDYIRSGELDDHMEWHNKNLYDDKNKSYNPDIVTRIIRNTKSKIKSKFYTSINTGKESDVTTHLANIIGNKILPPIGYGSNPTKDKKDSNINNNNRLRKIKKLEYNLATTQIIHGKDYLKIPFTFKFVHGDNIALSLELIIVSDSNKINLNSYESFYNINSPIYIENVEIDDNNYTLTTKKTKMSKKTSEVIIKKSSLDSVEFKEVNGIITIKTNNKNIISNIVIKEVDINE